MHSRDFIRALENGFLEMMEKIPKSDLHSHAGRGGSQACIAQQLGVTITPPSQPFENLGEMNTWLRQNVNRHFPDKSGYLQRLEAAFVQAAQDHIQVLALSFATDEFRHVGNIRAFAAYMEALHQKYASNCIFSRIWRSDMSKLKSMRWMKYWTPDFSKDWASVTTWERFLWNS